MAAKPEQIEFNHEDWSTIIERATDLHHRGRGWINISPEVEDEEGLAQGAGPVIGLGAMFRTFGPTVPSATWVFRTAKDPATVGIQHNLRAKVFERLRDNGVEPPPGSFRLQDNPRRGLVLRLADDVTVEVVVAWLMEAVDYLCPLQLTGQWLAEVHGG